MEVGHVISAAGKVEAAEKALYEKFEGARAYELALEAVTAIKKLETSQERSGLEKRIKDLFVAWGAEEDSPF